MLQELCGTVLLRREDIWNNIFLTMKWKSCLENEGVFLFKKKEGTGRQSCCGAGSVCGPELAAKFFGKKPGTFSLWEYFHWFHTADGKPVLPINYFPQKKMWERILGHLELLFECLGMMPMIPQLRIQGILGTPSLLPTTSA